MKLKDVGLITVETTNLCDAHCVICPREKFKQKPKIMDVELFAKIVDEVSELGLGTIDTCGFGECFLDPYLFKRFQYIRERMPKVKNYISTNGYHMTSEKWVNVVKLIDIVKFSIYGLTKETHESFHRGRVKFEQTYDNIVGYTSWARRMNGNRPYTIGLLVVTDINRHEMEDWIEFWEPKLDEVFVWTPHNWIRGREYRQIDTSNQKSCGRPMNGPPYIHADGTVGPCCWDINKEIKLGDVNTQTLEEIYNGEPYQKLREAHKSGDFSLYPCKDCDQTNTNPNVLLYKSNPLREVGQVTSNMRRIA
jgi:radical SAM protein with 4Fe4S-binding SPASM domain